MVATSVVETDISKIHALFELQKANHRNVAKTTAKERIRKLRKFQKTLMKYRPEIKEAMWKEYRKPAAEVDLTEIFPLTSEIKHTCSNLRIWMRDEAVDTPLSLFGSSSWIRYEAKGMCLIISPWNYPMQLGFGPLISAVAAGNTAIIKPSEAMPHTSAVMRKIIAEVFDENEVVVVEGAVETATSLLDLPFSHIFFTGAPSIGKIVMAAAAKNLASVTLELGGKSPTIIDETANIGGIVNRIAWAKFCNNGQICIAPDYILVHESKKEEFIDRLQKQIVKHYGEDPSQSPDYMRIVNKRHFNRIRNYLENTISVGGKVAFGGKMNAEENYIEPTVLTDVPMDSDVMQNEIFGPLLPIVTYKNNEEVIELINSKEKPLALYIYSRSRKNTNYFIENTSAGGTSINMSGVHFGNMNLPFGGVNNSGIGKSHGHFGFKEFSNARGVFKQWLPSAIEFMMPPYNNWKEKMIELTIKWF